MQDEPRTPRRGPFSAWTTRRWLRAGAGLSLVVLVLLGVLGFWVLDRSQTISTQLVDVRSPALSTAFRLESVLLNQETGIRGYGITGNPEFLQPYRQGLADEKAHVATLTRLLHGDADALADLAAVEDAAARWRQETAEPIAAAPPGAPSPQTAALADTGKAAFDRLRAALAGEQDHLRADRAAARADLLSTTRIRNWVFTAIAVVIAVLTALVFEGLRRGINRPLERLGADARRIAAGDFEHPIVPTGPADLRRLSAEIDSMRRRLTRELAFTEQARLRLDAQAADLQRSNTELEQFAYVASHDLQEPLRKVSSFTQLLRRRYGGQLDAKADQYIDFAVDGANRMQVMINDLLDFSRVGRVHHNHQEVDLEHVLERTLETLSIGIEEVRGEITHDSLPTLVADPTQMGMLWQNLIGNAVKFRRPGVPPRVHVSAEREGGLWRFAVTDNGIGIPAQFAVKVFVIFQRLHTKEEYAGSGIGLAMCKKIVEFHGGTIEVDPTRTDGTRITFTLAAEPPELPESPDSPEDPAAPSTEQVGPAAPERQPR
ncbi:MULTISPECIES: sensor histidine kinase [Kitasatospora]|uniref:histidine kinase n=1 Tax=Kitasatospora setae (strain ATCC 33774 / DSM 43861 / JCM 3304 / KCC A-0304 / NBRC 14216 / KM-6054) TaxID=452652 RepID=E4N5Z0_KITSK|nr:MULTISPECIES: sensor histidine kinase [Kitasatospora]BAJ26621.1 putative two-component system sensor kinase [Kitasatospora setae KM-6054]